MNNDKNDFGYSIRLEILEEWMRQENIDKTYVIGL